MKETSVDKILKKAYRCLVNDPDNITFSLHGATLSWGLKKGIVYRAGEHTTYEWQKAVSVTPLVMLSPLGDKMLFERYDIVKGRADYFNREASCFRSHGEFELARYNSELAYLCKELGVVLVYEGMHNHKNYKFPVKIIRPKYFRGLC
jgi:hypothetical protein